MTTIPGPYELVATERKQRIQSNIPTDIHERLFLDVLPRRGSQDRVMTIFIAWLDSQTKHLVNTNSLENETQVIRLLQPLIAKQPIQTTQCQT